MSLFVSMILASSSALLIPNVISVDRQYVSELIAEGNVAYINEDYGVALDYYYRAVKADPDDEIAAANYSLVMEKLGFHDAAGWYIFEFLRTHPKSPTAWNIRAIIAESERDWGKCQRFAEEALKVNPNLAAAQYNRACYLAMQGRRPEAIIALRIAFYQDIGLANLAFYDEHLAPLANIPAFWELLFSQLNQ